VCSGLESGARFRAAADYREGREPKMTVRIVVGVDSVDFDGCSYRPSQILPVLRTGRVHQTLGITPAMEAGVANHV
jgi:hypothetical protein